MLTLSVMPDLLAVAQLPNTDDLPRWAAMENDFFSITKTSDELSIVCLEEKVPQGIKAERGWRCIKVEGPLDFGLTGILSSLTKPLATAQIPIFAISTFDTDYILVKEENLQKAKDVLSTFCRILSETVEAKN